MSSSLDSNSIQNDQIGNSSSHYGDKISSTSTSSSLNSKRSNNNIINESFDSTSNTYQGISQPIFSSISSSLSSNDFNIYLSFIRDEDNPKIAAGLLKDYFDSQASMILENEMINSVDRFSNLSNNSNIMNESINNSSKGKELNFVLNTKYDLAIIKNSRVFALLLSKRILSQPKNLLEMLFAVQNKIPITLILLENEGYDSSKVEDILLNFEFKLHTDIASKLKAQGIDLTDLAYNLSTILLDIQPMYPLSLSSESRRRSQLVNIQSGIMNSKFLSLNISMIQWLSLKERIHSSHTISTQGHNYFLSFRTIVSLMKQFQFTISSQDSETLASICNKIHHLSGGDNNETHDQCIRAAMISLGGCKYSIDGLYSYLGTEDFLTIALLTRTLSHFAKDDDSHSTILENIDLIITILGKYALDSNVQIWSCYLIFLLTKNEKNKSFLLQKGIVDSTIRSMENHQESSPIQNYCCGIFANLPDIATTFPFFTLRTIINLVVCAMKTYIEHIGVQELGCVMISNFSLSETLQSYLLLNGAVDGIIQSMRWHLGNRAVQLSGCNIINNLFINPEYHETLFKKGAKISIVDALRNHPENIEIQNIGNILLTNMTHYNQLNSNYSKNSANNLPVVNGNEITKENNNNRIENRKHVSEAALNGLLSISNEAELFNRMNKRGRYQTNSNASTNEILASEYRSTLGDNSLMSNFSALQQNEQDGSFHHMSKLGNFQQYQNNGNMSYQQKIQNTGPMTAFSILQNIPQHHETDVIVLVIQDMSACPENPSVQIKGCGTLANLSAEKGNNMNMILKGAALAIVNAMNLHPDNPEVQESACRALSLFNGQRDIQIRLMENGIAPPIIRAMKKHSKHIGILCVGTRALANLSTVEENRAELKQLGTSEIIRQALKYLEQHKKDWDYSVQEWGQRTLINLAY